MRDKETILSDAGKDLIKRGHQYRLTDNEALHATHRKLLLEVLIDIRDTLNSTVTALENIETMLRR